MLSLQLIPAAVRSKAQDCSSSIAGIAGSNPAGGTDVFLVFVCVVLVEASATDLSLVHGSATDCVSLTMCDEVQQRLSTPTMV
jgi:hypothetical protein